MAFSYWTMAEFKRLDAAQMSAAGEDPTEQNQYIHPFKG